MKRHRLLMVSLLMVGLTGMASAAEAPKIDLHKAFIRPCYKLGMPSYTARRVIDMGKVKFTSRVFVSGTREREELDRGGRKIIFLRDGKAEISWDPRTRKGVRMPLPLPGKSARGKKPRVRFLTLQEGDKEVQVIQAKEGRRWKEVMRVTCRKDGVLLSKTFPVLVRGRTIRAKMKQVDIELKELPEDLFKVPEDIKFVRVKPRK